MDIKLSSRVIRRISFYYEALLKLNLPEEAYVSSAKLEEITGVSCNQVRQDFFYMGISIGKQRKGYQINKLLGELKKILSIDTGANVIVIGAGRLGRALTEYKLFNVRNIFVKALFDIKEELVGNCVHVNGEDIPILHIKELENFLKRNPGIKIALLTVPEENAEGILDQLVQLGIKGIVNFTPCILRSTKLSKDILVVNECIGASLYKIIYQINNQGQMGDLNKMDATALDDE